MYAATHRERPELLTLLPAAAGRPRTAAAAVGNDGKLAAPGGQRREASDRGVEKFARDPKAMERYFVNMYLPFFRDQVNVVTMDMAFTANTVQNPPAAWDRTFADLEALDAVGSLTKITCPTLVVRCELEPVLEEFSRLLTDKIAGARYAYVRGVYHFAHHEDRSVWPRRSSRSCVSADRTVGLALSRRVSG